MQGSGSQISDPALEHQDPKDASTPPAQSVCVERDARRVGASDSSGPRSKKGIHIRAGPNKERFHLTNMTAKEKYSSMGGCSREVFANLAGINTAA